MNYDCLIYEDRFIVAKLSGWKWSAKEQQYPFRIAEKTLIAATEDYSVDLGEGVSAMASEIDPALVEVQ